MGKGMNLLLYAWLSNQSLWWYIAAVWVEVQLNDWLSRTTENISFLKIDLKLRIKRAMYCSKFKLLVKQGYKTKHKW